MLKSMRKSKNRYFYHTFVSPGAITLNVVWMEKNSMLTNCLAACTHLSSTVSQLFELQVQKTPFSRTAAHIFVSPGDAPATITQYVAWMERQFNACKTPRIACTYLSSIVSELYDA